MNQLKLLQKFGKTKGFIFSMDALVGLMIVIMVLTVANIFISRIEFSSLAELQMIKRSSDITKIIDEKTYTTVESGTPPTRFEIGAIDFLIIGHATIINNDINPYINTIINLAGGTAPDPNNPAIDLRMSINATCVQHNSNTGPPLIPATQYSPYSSLPANFILPKDRFIPAEQRIIVIPNKQNPLQTIYCIGDIRSWLP